jgi:glycosyltransferase involved in cell wall biosynthesis
MIKKLAIITTHPIQYYAPVFQLMAKELNLKVFYTWGKASVNKFDAGFKKQVEWDLPLLDGYDSTFLENIAKDQGTHHFNGIVNPHLIDTVQSFKPDAILVYGWAWKSHLKAIRYFKGKIPVYFRGDSTLLNYQFGLKSILKKIFLKWIYRHIDLAFYVGEQNKAYFKKYGVNEKQLVFAPHAIDNERFAEDRYIEANYLRTKLGIDSNEILILFAGKFDLVKSPFILLDAFINLDLKNTHLLFVGNGVLEESLKLKVEGLGTKRSFDYAQDDKLEGAHDDNEHSSQLGVRSWKEKINEKSFDYAQDDSIKKRIHFMDFQNQTAMPVVYQACDLFCLPSLSETWGLAVNEAMAAGKAILLSDKVGCATDLVKPTINGKVFKSGDLADLKQKLKALTENKTKLAQMGSASQQIIQEWSFEKQVSVIVGTIENEHAK